MVFSLYRHVLDFDSFPVYDSQMFFSLKLKISESSIPYMKVIGNLKWARCKDGHDDEG